MQLGRRKKHGREVKGRHGKGQREYLEEGQGKSRGRGSVFKSVGKRMEGVSGRGFKEGMSDKRRVEE